MAYDSVELSQVWRVGVEARRQVKDGEVDEGEKRGRHEAWKSVSIFFNYLSAIWHCWDAIHTAAL